MFLHHAKIEKKNHHKKSEEVEENNNFNGKLQELENED
jgi:hypothetical protein